MYMAEMHIWYVTISSECDIYLVCRATSANDILTLTVIGYPLETT